MTISAELIATAILGVSLVSLGWKVSSDIRHELRQEIHLVRNKLTGEFRHEIHLVRKDVAALGDRMGSLEQRMARLEGWIEGRFKEEPELKARPATSP